MTHPPNPDSALDLNAFIGGSFRNAAHDYAAARCCFKAGCVWSAGPLSQQSIEKLLKGWIARATNERLGAPPRGRSHDLKHWASIACSQGLQLADVNELLQALTDTYERKYIDGNNVPTQSFRDRCRELDELVVGILRQCIQQDQNQFFLEFAIAGPGATLPNALWIATGNEPLRHALADFASALGPLVAPKLEAAIEWSPVQHRW